MKFALCRGKSPIGSIIEWWTRSLYSHVAMLMPDGSVYEAVPEGFVHVPSLATNNRGTKLDILAYKDPLSAAEISTARRTLDAMVGERYDYRMLLGFPLRATWEPPNSKRRLFCSEAAYLVSAALGSGRLLLERTQPWKVTPEMISLSPLLKWDASVVP